MTNKTEGKHIETVSGFVGKQSTRIEELEAINAELLKALKNLLRRERRNYGNTSAAQKYFAENFATELAVVAKAKGTIP